MGENNKYKTLFFISLIIVIILLGFLLYSYAQKPSIIDNARMDLFWNVQLILPNYNNYVPWLENKVVSDTFTLEVPEEYSSAKSNILCEEEFDKREHYENPVSPGPDTTCFIETVNLLRRKIDCICYYATKNKG